MSIRTNPGDPHQELLDLQAELAAEAARNAELILEVRDHDVLLPSLEASSLIAAADAAGYLFTKTRSGDRYRVTDLGAQVEALGIRVGGQVRIDAPGTSAHGHIGAVTRIGRAPAEANGLVKAWVWVEGGPSYGILPKHIRPTDRSVDR